MNASLRTLLSGVVDYAGLFPPARLPLDEAIRNYARYRQEPDAWMLGRFVAPVQRLNNLVPFWQELFRAEPRLVLAVLGAPSSDGQKFLAGQKEENRTLLDFRDRNGAWAIVETLELQLSAVPHLSLMNAIRSYVQCEDPVETVYFEAPPERDSRPGILEVTAALQSINGTTQTGAALEASRAGFKLRCGGLKASAFPTVQQVAFALHACRVAAVPLKFTAGLHHPLRHFDASVKTHVHGFINVFVAGVLAYGQRLNAAELEAVIAEEDPAHFVFTDDGLAWKDHHASTEEIAVARRDFVTSFGSCSFDEPRDDLRALGWL